MLHAVKKVEYIKDYKLKLTFRNNDVKIVDLEKELCGPMLEPLKDTEYFKLVKTDNHTIVWPNEVDFCPDMLHEIGIQEVQTKAKPPLKRRKQNKTKTVSIQYQPNFLTKKISKKTKS